jgi:S-adenosylmethionine:tRNA ribosyltransferase-isomerase
MLTAEYDYVLPADRIAQVGVEPRDASRLLIASTLEELRFRDLGTILDDGDLVVVNRTRVRHARLNGSRRGTGGRVEVLLTGRIDATRWEALVKPSRRLVEGTIIDVADRAVTLMSDPRDGVATVAITPGADVEDFIAANGSVPLPPYIRGGIDDPERYQTIFAESVGSSAAPTAALHFTPAVVADLAGRGVGIAQVELDVGLDTFRPMSSDRVEDHRIHTERIHVPEETARAIAETRRRGGRVVAVGTTVTRTLETAADGAGGVVPFEGHTSLFITPGYRPRVIDAMITNFHAPRTSLLVMIAALIGPRWRDVYAHALDHGFRFLSFGDAMYVEVRR